MLKVLIIDNNVNQSDWGAAEFRDLKTLSPDVTITVRRGPHRDLPKRMRDFDRVILTGSLTRAADDLRWVFELEDFVKKAMDESIPVLGVCYGHQLLGRILCGKEEVGPGPEYEIGWGEVELVGESMLTKGLPKRFHTNQQHYDEIKKIPDDAQIIAKSNVCEIQGFALEDQGVFGVQFHPERTLEPSRKTKKEHLESKSDAPFLNADRDKELYDPKIGQTIFRNFIGITT